MSTESRQAIEQVLGYLNFSSGTADPQLLANLNTIWRAISHSEAERGEADEGATWQRVGRLLQEQLTQLRVTNATFQDVSQAEAALDRLLQGVLPGYLEFHADLLFHVSDETLVNAFFFGRACEATLRQAAGSADRETIVGRAIAELSDFIGYRPVAVLESKRVEPYAHEWVAAVPLFVRGAGVADGPCREVLELALDLLNQTPPDLLQMAYFDPQLLDELAVDPRAYDFDHPVNKRPNYHFGQWDPHRIDGQGRYRRYVVQQVTLDALMQRLADPGDLPREELLFEAASVLAGTLLMSTGVSGSGPECFDSMTSLASLLPRIAAYRDAFYEQLIEQTNAAHRRRLEEERLERRQPFGAARQHLNAQLARRRASQLEHVQLAKLYARMGYSDAAARQATIVPTASARLMCQIDCRLTSAGLAVDDDKVAEAVSLLGEVVALLHRGIACGAIVDPWNILGFDGQFSLFPALENSVHDHRVDELIEIMEQIFGLYSRAWSRAAAGSNEALCDQLRTEFLDLVTWWRQFAAHEVSNVDAVDAMDAFQAAEHVAQAIRLWHQGGAATGDVGFWAPHAAIFDSPRAYALVIEALFEQADLVASLGLLIHWLGATDRIALEQCENSFHRLAERWLIELRSGASDEQGAIGVEDWQRIRKFFDYLEANADELWKVPQFELGDEAARPGADDAELEQADDLLLEEDEGDDVADLFGAAYEGVVYHDSTDDGIEGPLFDTGHSPADDLMLESERLSCRLAFLSTLARLWRAAALTRIRNGQGLGHTDRVTAMQRWSDQARENHRGLNRLMNDVHRFRTPAPTGDHDSMLEYDRRRLIKETLLERIIETCVETADAARMLAAAAAAVGEPIERTSPAKALPDDDEERLSIEAFAAVLERNIPRAKTAASQLMRMLESRPLLYVPLAKGGSPVTIVRVRVRQRGIQDLQKCLPRLGLFVEACQLLETARVMERDNPVGPGAVTEFDELFKTGYKSLVECLVGAAEAWERKKKGRRPPVNSQLVARLEQLTESLLASWLEHSRTLRLSVLEKVSDAGAWKRLVAFIETYGGDLFTQRFLYLGNVRAILHQGVDEWLMMIKDAGFEDDVRLFDELDRKISLEDAAQHLSLVLEAIVENYGEYRDYNSTTTQSDRGELLYSLLDFLRLRAKYDRVCWNLKPVVLAHHILVRRGRKRAAQMWRRALRDRICEEADKYQKRLVGLQKKYAMQMPSIADRIGERFVRALVIDRLCALVGAAVDEARTSGSKPNFRILEYETETLTREPSGVGFDVPAWLVALEEEVERVRLPEWERDDYDELNGAVPALHLTHDEISKQLDACTRKKAK